MKFKCQVPEVLDIGEQQRIYDSALGLLAQVPLRADGTEEFIRLCLISAVVSTIKRFIFQKPL